MIAQRDVKENIKVFPVAGSSTINQIQINFKHKVRFKNHLSRRSFNTSSKQFSFGISKVEAVELVQQLNKIIEQSQPEFSI